MVKGRDVRGKENMDGGWRRYLTGLDAEPRKKYDSVFASLVLRPCAQSLSSSSCESVQVIRHGWPVMMIMIVALMCPLR
jgi:hypothetical protein